MLANYDDISRFFRRNFWRKLSRPDHYGPKHPYFIGMMSGTSLDGMDAVLCRFLETDDETCSVEIIAKPQRAIYRGLTASVIIFNDAQWCRSIYPNLF